MQNGCVKCMRSWAGYENGFGGGMCFIGHGFTKGCTDRYGYTKAAFITKDIRRAAPVTWICEGLHPLRGYAKGFTRR